ncbi:MAG: dephospho-CoA kinase [Firmicutes bacterium]|nr:dephospho-CoA kinase [Bacillota bacterium]
MKPNKTNCYVIGLTGTIAAGKSTVLTYLQERYHARCFDCDLIARDIVNESRNEIADLFGETVLDGETINRNALSSIVFEDRQALEQLNALIHPRVCAFVEREIAALSGEGNALAVIEAIGLLTTPLKDLCSSIWVVSASPEVRIERMLKTRGMTREEAINRIRSQWDDETFRAKADVVIQTDAGSLDAMRSQVDQALERDYPSILSGQPKNQASAETGNL